MPQSIRRSTIHAFWHWLEEEHKNLLLIGSALAVLWNLVFPFWPGVLWIDPLWHPAVGHFVQASMILICIIQFSLWNIQQPPIGQKGPEKNADDMAMQSVKQFYTYFHQLFVAWFLLYFALTVSDCWQVLGISSKLYQPVAIQPPTLARIKHCVLNLLNNATGLYFFLCYWILAEDTIHKDVPRVAAFCALALITLVDCFFTAVVPDSVFLQSATTRVDVVWAIFSGVAIALLAGRVESEFIIPPLTLVIMFYVYAVVQAFWPYFSQDRVLARFLTNFALMPKMLMYLFIYWISCRNRIFLFYMKKTRYYYAGGERDKYLSAP